MNTSKREPFGRPTPIAPELQAKLPGSLMKRAILGGSVAAAIALVPLCIRPAQAHADDPCVGITDPAAYQACIGEFPRDGPMHRSEGECHASPRWGAEGQFCRNSWVRKSNRGSDRGERILAAGDRQITFVSTGPAASRLRTARSRSAVVVPMRQRPRRSGGDSSRRRHTRHIRGINRVDAFKFPKQRRRNVA